MMKRHLLLSFAAMLLATLNMNAQDLKGDVNNDGNVDVSDVTLVVSYILNPPAPEPQLVDLGLPSGTLWASFDLGATKPEQAGSFFAWGEAVSKATYTKANYVHLTDGKLTKYCTSETSGTVDNLTQLQPEDDAATALWGEGWCTPTKEQWLELSNYCEWWEVKLNDVNVLMGMSNENSEVIYFPYGGKKETTASQVGEYGYYWTSTLSTESTEMAYTSSFKRDQFPIIEYDKRETGYAIRPVATKGVALVEDITLSENAVTMQVGDTKRLLAVVTPFFAANPNFTWNSSDMAVATVADDGTVTAVHAGQCEITATASDAGHKKVACVIKIPEDGSHECVDLGLPSGTLWATTDIGAPDENSMGDFFAWGETSTKSTFGNANYKWYNYSVQLTKYCLDESAGEDGFTDGLTTLLPEDDAATQLWGDDWCMPTQEQWEELFNSEYCTLTVKTTAPYGIYLTSKKNGNTILLLYQGTKQGSTVYNASNHNVHYWTPELGSDGGKKAIVINCQGLFQASEFYRHYGCLIRPVSTHKAVRVTGIQLACHTLTLQQGQTFTMFSQVMPEDAGDKALVWTSSNASVANVADDGTVTARSGGTSTITATAVDGSGMTASCVVTVPYSDTHEYVDLGLTSGTLWATTNVGADNPEEIGDYFAWGETTPKTNYTESTYAHCKGSLSTTQTKYCNDESKGYNGYVDDLTRLESDDDAATVIWGEKWCMPTHEQVEELKANCTVTSTSRNGVAGKLFTGPNNNAIFIPNGGEKTYTTTRYPTQVLFWSSDLYSNSNQAWSYCVASGANFTYAERVLGRNIRPVRATGSVRVASLQLNAAITMRKGEMLTLFAVAYPSDATNPDVKWSTSNNAIATVTTGGDVTAMHSGQCIITATTQDGSGVQATCTVTVLQDNTNHEYVDLGLSSGTLWATTNVGASAPEQGGDFLAWGETNIKKIYTKETYAFYDAELDKLTKYCCDDDLALDASPDSRTRLTATDDAATANWGDKWCMPTLAQIQELKAQCTVRNIMINGERVFELTGPSGKSIILPIAGFKKNTTQESKGSVFRIWASDLYEDDNLCANSIRGTGSEITVGNLGREFGLNVRPVAKAKAVKVSSISLSSTEMTLNPKDMQLLGVTIYPANTSLTDVTWSSNNTNVAKMAADGTVIGNHPGQCTITATATDGSGKKASCTVTVLDNATHTSVDLGLPSGTLWATMNVGATSATDYGDYYAWGELAPKDDFQWADYKFGDPNGNGFTKYTTGNAILTSDDDVATLTWGSDWCIPTTAQTQELLTNCSSEMITSGGWTYAKFTGPNNNFIYIPASGYKAVADTQKKDNWACFWTSSLRETATYGNTLRYSVNDSYNMIGALMRFCGAPVRPVAKKKAARATGIIISASELTLDAGSTQVITARVTPAEAGIAGITWTSSDTNVASVDGNGVITAKNVSNYSTCTITATANDGSGKKATCTVNVKANNDNGHGYVDLGLPSGTLWATMNLGASYCYEVGDRIAWAELNKKSYYDESSYKYHYAVERDGFTFHYYTKYTETNPILELSDDAAHSRWKGNWRIPTSDQWLELFNDAYTDITWISYGGVYGYMITSKSNRNSIFIPVSGYQMYSTLKYETEGYYWTNRLHFEYVPKQNDYEDAHYNIFQAYCLKFTSSGKEITVNTRFYGQPIRPVITPFE